MSPYDLSKGRIIFRHKSASAANSGARRAPFRRH
jgi:hypothetical protein